MFSLLGRGTGTAAAMATRRWLQATGTGTGMTGATVAALLQNMRPCVDEAAAAAHLARRWASSSAFPSTLVWEPVPDPESASMPAGRCGLGAAQLGSHVFVLGGDVGSPPDGTASSEFVVRKVVSSPNKQQAPKGWVAVQALNAGPDARFGHSFSTSESSLSLFMAGGSTGRNARTAEFWRFVVYPQTLSRGNVAGEWHILPELPEPRDLHTATLIEGASASAIIIGGRGPQVATADVWSYSVPSSKWTKLYDAKAHGPSPDAPVALAGHAAVPSALAPEIVVFGPGYPALEAAMKESVPDGVEPANAVWAFNLSSKTWRRMGSDGGGPPLPVAGASAVSTDGGRTMIVVGGATVDPESGEPSWHSQSPWLYDFASESWHPLKSVNEPAGIVAHGVIPCDGHFLVIGGETADRTPTMAAWNVTHVDTNE
ncbi:uncharacterized protein AMSG_04921 [Thecamonas trahens ATCC 50062]|uniref:Attractin/MKLN-like beta-propeller domain-containing protein n=1 Tax=Thecamonas trahens ATCC 50062 TaxID=461836 RepID=A0A0L0DAZ9_THETB|nr:hypothetical protein AMSG_04921 [Thecamonas trahens ATCC 50062]KNC48473.1 hypothetical protein AMSG_04921 [Thecamonas trahens ATCC 50062]|eukprot:XP_013758585.1 hypothetical protein AMSG_04921 [Thecamonas trahens ATCC 50062]